VLTRRSRIHLEEWWDGVSLRRLQIEVIETGAHDLLRLTLSLRNLLQPINGLPLEIVSRIAQSVLHCDPDQDARSIIPLTHVCRYWRESIISNPENWTNIISDNSGKLVALNLERAKAAPLDVHLFMHSTTPGFFDILTRHIQNIGSLRVYSISVIEDLTRRLPNFPWSMPTLQALELHGSNGGDWDRSVDPFKSSAHAFNSEISCVDTNLVGLPTDHRPRLLSFRN